MEGKSAGRAGAAGGSDGRTSCWPVDAALETRAGGGSACWTHGRLQHGAVRANAPIVRDGGGGQTEGQGASNAARKHARGVKRQRQR